MVEVADDVNHEVYRADGSEYQSTQAAIQAVKHQFMDDYDVEYDDVMARRLTGRRFLAMQRSTD